MIAEHSASAPMTPEAITVTTNPKQIVRLADDVYTNKSWHQYGYELL